MPICYTGDLISPVKMITMAKTGCCCLMKFGYVITVDLFAEFMKLCKAGTVIIKHDWPYLLMQHYPVSSNCHQLRVLKL